MNILITGGCGFIGLALVKKLMKNLPNVSIRIIDNLSVGTLKELKEAIKIIETPIETEIWPTGVQFFQADICDPEALKGIFDGVHSVVHLAANTGVGPSVIDPTFDCFSNVNGTVNVLEAARFSEAQKFVFASSGAPLGEQIPPLHEEMVPRPVSPYGASKLAGEAYCSAYYKTYSLATVCLRFSNVYGPGSGNKSSVVAKFIKQALNMDVIEIFGDGEQTRDFIYINDLVQAIVSSIQTPNIGGEVFQIASSEETNVNQITNKLRQIFETKNKVFPEVKFGEMRQGDVTRNFSDTRKAKKLLGWEVTTNLDVGLNKTVDFFLDKECNR